MKKLSGITVAMLTPFQSNGEVDLTALQEMTERLIGCGVDCLYPCGTTGTGMWMDNRERMTVAEAVVEAAHGRIPVFVHTGANQMQDTILLTRHAVSIGADGAGVVTPFFFHLSDEELFAFYRAVSESVPADFPLYLYNIPQLAGNDLASSVVYKLAKHCENIVGIKYSQPNMERAQAYTRARDGFSVLMGTDAIVSGCLATGLDGIVSGTACVFPEVLTALKRAVLSGENSVVRTVEDRAMALCQATRNGSVPYLTAALHWRGLGNNVVRMPFLSVTGDAYARMVEELERTLGPAC